MVGLLYMQLKVMQLILIFSVIKSNLYFKIKVSWMSYAMIVMICCEIANGCHKID